MAKDALAEFVVNEAKAFVTSDGGDVKLIDVRDSTAFVRYKKGHNSHCAECVLSADALHDFLAEMFCEKAPHITGVEVELAD